MEMDSLIIALWVFGVSFGLIFLGAFIFGVGWVISYLDRIRLERRYKPEYDKQGKTKSPGEPPADDKGRDDSIPLSTLSSGNVQSRVSVNPTRPVERGQDKERAPQPNIKLIDRIKKSFNSKA